MQAGQVTGGGKSVAAASTQYIDEKQVRMSHVAPAATLAKYHAAMMQRGTGRTVPEAHARMHMEHMLPGSLECQGVEAVVMLETLRPRRCASLRDHYGGSH